MGFECPERLFFNTLKGSEALNFSRESKNERKIMVDCGDRSCKLENRLQIWRERKGKLTPL